MNTKKEIKEIKEIRGYIESAIDAIVGDIQRDENADDNLKRAEAIKTLAEAYRGLGR